MTIRARAAVHSGRHKNTIVVLDAGLSQHSQLQAAELGIPESNLPPSTRDTQSPALCMGINVWCTMCSKMLKAATAVQRSARTPKTSSAVQRGARMQGAASLPVQGLVIVARLQLVDAINVRGSSPALRAVSQDSALGNAAFLATNILQCVHKRAHMHRHTHGCINQADWKILHLITERQQTRINCTLRWAPSPLSRGSQI